MTDLIKKGKKVFTVTVVLTTIAWSIGLGALALPLAANAVTSGDLIKGTGTAVYYYGADGKRYLFPNAGTYMSWYTDWSGVQSLTDEELIAIPLGGNVTIRPGQLAQFVSMDTPWHVMDSKIYAIEQGGVMRWVQTAEVAEAIFGSDWASKIVAVPEVLSTNYTVGSNIASAGDYDLAAQQAVSSINEDKGLVGAGAGLTVALASDSPAAQTVPTNADGVTVAKFSFNAASAATLTDVVLHRVGVGAPSDIDNVYLYDGSTRLTSGRSVGTTSNLVEFHSLSVALSAGVAKTLTVKVDIGNPATTGGVHAFEIQDASAVTAGSLVVSATAWPVKASDFTIGSAAVSTVTVTKGTTPADITVGEVGAEISSFKLAAGTNDVALSSVSLMQAGTASNSDISDLELWVGSTLLASTASMSGDKMIFVLSEPYTIAAGVTKTFTVKATVGGRGGRTVKTYVEYATDVAVTDKTYGYGANVDIAAFDGGAGEYIEVTTKGGAITVAFNGPVATNVSKGAQDVVFYDFSLTSASANVEVRKLDIKVYGDGAGKLYEGTDRNLTDIKVKDQATGATLMGPKELAVAGGETVTQTINFTDAFTLNAGQTKRLIVTMDTRNTDDADFINHWFKVELQAFGADYIKNVDTGEYVTDIVPNSANLGNAMTVKAASLTVTLSSVPASQTAVKRTTALDLVAFNMAAGSQSAVKVTALKLTGKGDIGDGTYAYGEVTADDLDDVVTSLKLYDGTTMLGTAKAPGTDGTATFSGLNWTIPAGETKQLTVKADLASAIGDGNDDFAALGIATAADITAEDADANAVTPTDGDAAWDAPKNDTGAVFPVLLTVKDSGTLTMALDSATPAAAIVVAGNSNVDVTKIKLSATMENFDVTTLSLSNAEYASGSTVAAGDTDIVAGVLTLATNVKCAAGDTAWDPGDYAIVDGGTLLVYNKADDYVLAGTAPAEGTVIAACADVYITGGDATYTNGEKAYNNDAAGTGADIEVGDDRLTAAGTTFDDSVVSVVISYPTASGTETKTGYLSNGQVDFSGMNFRVPKDGDGVLTVKLNVNTITGGADSGDKPRMNFHGFNFAAVGQDSGTTIHGITPAGSANFMVVRKTKPTISLHASSPSGSLVPGVTEVLRLNVTADAGGDVYFDKGAAALWAAGDGKFDFLANSTGGDGVADDVCSLWDASDDTKVDEVTVNLPAAATVEVPFNFYASASIGRDFIVPAGSTKTLYVKCDLQEFTTTGDTFRLDLVRDTTTPGESDTGTLNPADNVRWHDNSAADINGFLVKNLDVTGGTLVK